MKMSSKTRLLLSAVSAAAIAISAAPSFAQDSADDQTVVLDSSTSFEDDDDTVVVTGSRIRRTDIESVFPTTVVDAGNLEVSAFTNIADALTEIPAFGGGIDAVGDQGANIGANFVDFLDLGVQRTLTVVNGRRFVTSDVGGNGLSVDFNIIPLALVERIETVGVGGAPIYGADAIAGTINVILKDDFEGLQGTALFGETERGDGERRQFQVVAGVNSDDGRGNVTFSAEYTQDDGLRFSDRPEIYSDEPFLSEVPCNTAGFNNLDGDGDGVVCPDDNLASDSVFRTFNQNGGNGQNVQLFTNGGVVTPSALILPSVGAGAFPGQPFLGFDEGGNLIPLEAGASIPGQSLFFAQGGFDNDFFDAVDQVRSPLERIQFSSTAKYDITDNITFKGDAQIANTKAAEIVDQGGFQTFAFDGPINNDIGGALQLPVSNAFLSDQARDIFINDIGLGPDDTFFFSRFNNDLLDGGERTAETNVWRFTGGLEGDFEFADREFFWDIHGVAGQATNETQGNALNDTRFLNAIEAVSLTQADVDGIAAAGNNPIGGVGDIVCQTTRDLALITAQSRVLSNDAFTGIRGIVTGSGVANQDAEDVTQCQPLNLFGEGVASEAALDFVNQRTIVSNNFEQRIWSANFGGQIIELPAGWASFNVGYEARQEAVLFATGGAVEVGLGRGAATPDSGGSFSTDELYGEVLLPIISSDLDIPLVDTLEAEGAIRDISTSIDGGDATVWTVAGTYKPVPDLTLKGNRTRSVRTPSLQELFQPVVTQFDFANDPCDARFISDDIEGQEGTRAANCAAVGITQPFTSNIVNATAQGLTGGNPDLLVETADAWTLGAVIQPRWVPGLTIQADYINIEIEDLIGARSVEQNLEACFDQVNFDPTSPTCSSFSRDGTGQIASFISGQINSDAAEYQFLNFRADYRFDVRDAFNLFGTDKTGDLGSLNLDFNAFHAIQRDIIVDGVPLDNTIGGFLDPRWSGTADLTYRKDGLRVFWRTLWQDRALFSASGNNVFANADDEFVNSTPGRFLHNASISYDLSELTDNYEKPLVVQLNVDNVFDRSPGRGERRTFNDFGLSEILGRRFTMRVSATF